MYVKRNIEARSRNHWCCGKAMSRTQTDCVKMTRGTNLMQQL